MTDLAVVDALVDALAAGEAVVVPTDTIYGVGALPSVPGATARLFALKDRPPDTPLAVLVADVAQGLALLDRPPPALVRLVEAHWPGPLTVVGARADPAAGWDLGGDPSTVGVRCPDHDLVRAVAARVGPIATTSANRHGEPTPTTAAAAAAALVGPVAVVADGGVLAGAASTVVVIDGEDLDVRREGTLTRADLARTLGRSES